MHDRFPTVVGIRVGDRFSKPGSVGRPWADGRCKEYTYQGQNRKYQFKMEEKVSEKKVYRLVCSLQKIIGAPLWEKNVVEGQVCDGCSFNLQITYADKRKEIINGDVAGGTFD